MEKAAICKKVIAASSETQLSILIRLQFLQFPNLLVLLILLVLLVHNPIFQQTLPKQSGFVRNFKTAMICRDTIRESRISSNRISTVSSFGMKERYAD